MEQRAHYPQMDPKLQAQHGGRFGGPQSNSLNIIQQADSAKNLSDRQIQQAFQSGQFMPYILLAEMQNRKAARAEAQSEAASNTTTVAEDLMGGQDRNVDLTNAPQVDPRLQQMHGGRAGVEGIPGAQQQPAAYAEGGIVGYARGGEIIGELLRLVRTGRITLEEVLAKLNLDPSSPEAAEVAREFESILADQTISEDDRKVGVGGPYGGRDDEGPTVGSDLGALGRTDPEVAEGLAAFQKASQTGPNVAKRALDKNFEIRDDVLNAIYKRSQSTDPDGPGVLRRLQDEAKRARSLGALRPPGMKDEGPTVGSDLGALGRTDPEVAEGLAAFQKASQTGPNVAKRALDKNFEIRDDVLNAIYKRSQSTDPKDGVGLLAKGQEWARKITPQDGIVGAFPQDFRTTPKAELEALQAARDKFAGDETKPTMKAQDTFLEGLFKGTQSSDPKDGVGLLAKGQEWAAEKQPGPYVSAFGNATHRAIGDFGDAADRGLDRIGEWWSGDTDLLAPESVGSVVKADEGIAALDTVRKDTDTVKTDTGLGDDSLPLTAEELHAHKNQLDKSKAAALAATPEKASGLQALLDPTTGSGAALYAGLRLVEEGGEGKDPLTAAGTAGKDVIDAAGKRQMATRKLDIEEKAAAARAETAKAWTDRNAHAALTLDVQSALAMWKADSTSMATLHTALAKATTNDRPKILKYIGDLDRRMEMVWNHMKGLGIGVKGPYQDMASNMGGGRRGWDIEKEA